MAFVSSFVATSSFAGASVCTAKPAAKSAVVMAYDMNGLGLGNLGPKRIKSSAVEGDKRYFKIAYVLPSESRAYSGRELQNVYTVKLVPFSSWYSEQQRIMKMGGKITSVELVAGGKQRNVGNI
mmetsp:Transcript_6630/g.11974  ORF Transcript_6630/g.11974 Transcript_6630/m.11974 type:complete len:124 (+) Transcript_6630:84-455(+)|eukprot:CAMPEP_0184691636 /NCGR_PEP_ID=MMETSP0313-20130426/426_1 /TAXON_ID=2792 /ORGANISM="Porphyridium aerugineum, Strain SAG 1380-2" /LENGTH=123 /DNA_ID=CAMNT_0027149387 /DNA_START=119 /DNA_END=490 /DNA_ORIENTATION=-